MLPLEILFNIGEQSIGTHRALLAVPDYARYYQDRQGIIQKHFTDIVINEELGETKYLLNGKLHRLDGPALIWESGKKEWWIDGKKKNIEKASLQSSQIL